MMTTRAWSILVAGMVIALLTSFACSAVIAQSADGQPVTTYGAHPLQDHWGQSASGTGAGTRWTSSTGNAVTGITTAPGRTIGVLGRSKNGYGVYGTATNAAAGGTGVYGESAAAYGHGVFGYAISVADDSSAIGVLGASKAPGGYGVYGEGQRGVSGWSNGNYGVGVIGTSTATTRGVGVNGFSSSTDGVGGLFVASDPGPYFNEGAVGIANGKYGVGVEGRANATDGDRNVGVWATVNNNNGYGVLATQAGYSAGDISTAFFESGIIAGGWNGVIGFSKQPGGYGVLGHASATSGVGVYGTTTHADGWAGKFYSSAGHGVSISTPAGKIGLSVAGGTKNAIVGTSDGARLLYAEEATSVWFTDYGFSALKNGSIKIVIDPIFAETVNLNEPYHVFLEPYGNAALYVAERTSTSFTVRLHDGDASAQFSYRIVGRRLGYEDDRLARAPGSDGDPNLFPSAASTQKSTLQRPEKAIGADPATMKTIAIENPTLITVPDPPVISEDGTVEAPEVTAPTPTVGITIPAAPAPLPAGVNQLYVPALGK